MTQARIVIPVIQGPTFPTIASQADVAAGLNFVGDADCTVTPLSDLLDDLQQRGAVLALAGSKLSVKAPERLPDSTRRQIKTHLPALIRMFAPPPKRLRAVCSIWPGQSPRTLTLVAHNRDGTNQFGQEAMTHPYALINWTAWLEADWDLATCHWYRDAKDASGVEYTTGRLADARAA